MHKKFFILLILIFVSIFLSGCSIFGYNIPIPFLNNNKDNETSNSEPVEITYWSLFEPKEVYEPLIQEYQELHPNVTINFEQKVFDNLDVYKDSTLASLQSSESKPDILRLHSTWILNFKDYLAPAPNEIFSPDDISADFYQTTLDDVVLANKVYAIPLTFDSLALFYNKDIFNQNNITPPDNWSDFEDTAVSLTKTDSLGNILSSGAAFGSADNIAHFSDILGLLINQSDIELPRDINTEAFKDIIIFYTNFVKESNVWDRNQAYSPLAFSQGRVAMIFGPSWQLLNIIEDNPNLNVGVAPVPQIVSETDLTNDNFANYWVESVNSNSNNKEEAWEFLKWLSEEEQLLKAYSKASEMRVFGEPFPRISMQDELISNSYLGPFYVNANNAKSRKITDRVGNSSYVNIIKTIVEGVLDGRNIDELVQTADQEYRRLEEL